MLTIAPEDRHNRNLEAMFSQPHLGVRREEITTLATTISLDLDKGEGILKQWCDGEVPPFIKKRFTEAAETWKWLQLRSHSGAGRTFS